MQSDESYETRGILYFFRTDGGVSALIALSFEDHSELLGRGFKNEEVYLTIRKERADVDRYGESPEQRIRAGLSTITIEEMAKSQLSLDERTSEELMDRGYEDGERVLLAIEHSPYRVPSKPFAVENLNLDLDVRLK